MEHGFNRTYFACYYAAIALLLNKEIDVKEDNEVLEMFNTHFVKMGIISEDLGNYYQHIYNLRNKADEDDFAEFTKEDVTVLLAPAKELIFEIEKVILSH